jgi:UDP-sulfoquinovose synthase
VAAGMGLAVEIAHLENPRQESEDHYYNPAHSGLRELGLQPHPLTDDVIKHFLGWVGENKGNIREERIMPRVTWRNAR